MTGSSVFGCFGLTFAFVGERLFCILLVVSLYYGLGNFVPMECLGHLSCSRRKASLIQSVSFFLIFFFFFLSVYSNIRIIIV